MGHIERIINHLVIASSFTPNIGLYHGKMGIVISLCHYIMPVLPGSRYMTILPANCWMKFVPVSMRGRVSILKTGWPASGGGSSICCRTVSWKVTPMWFCAI